MRLFAIAFALTISAIVIGSAPVSAEEEKKSKDDTSKTVVVKKGDTLSKIAKENKTDYSRLFDANVKIKDPDIIYPNQKVRIPSEDEKLKKRKLPADTVVASSASSKPSQTDTHKAVNNNVSGGVWDRIAACESGGNWSINTGNGYYGGVQFSIGSWRAVGGSGYPHQASKSEQIKRAKLLQAQQGWGAWPACSSKLGLR